MSKNKMDMPTKEQILEAADDCPQAKGALKKLFPKAFDDDKEYCCNWMKDTVELEGISEKDYSGFYKHAFVDLKCQNGNNIINFSLSSLFIFSCTFFYP